MFNVSNCYLFIRQGVWGLGGSRVHRSVENLSNSRFPLEWWALWLGFSCPHCHRSVGNLNKPRFPLEWRALGLEFSWPHCHRLVGNLNKPRFPLEWRALGLEFSCPHGHRLVGNLNQASFPTGKVSPRVGIFLSLLNTNDGFYLSPLSIHLAACPLCYLLLNS